MSKCFGDTASQPSPLTGCTLARVRLSHLMNRANLTPPTATGRGLRVELELPSRPWRAPSLNETVTTFGLPSVPSAADALARTDRDAEASARDALVGRRFLLLRPRAALVTATRVEPAGALGLGFGLAGAGRDARARGILEGRGVGRPEEHLLVFFREEGGGESARPVSWFRANSRPAKR